MLLKYLSPVLTLLLLSLMLLDVRAREKAADAGPFHAAAAHAINSIPYTLGDWRATDLPLPAAAVTLLKPNATATRLYQNQITGERATMVIVQCRDARDMAGHYPPICYKGQGWVARQEPTPITLTVTGAALPVVRYDFTRPAFDRDQSVVIYGVFAVPGKGFPLDMDRIRRLAADYASRPFGAAQIHIVLNERISAEREQEIASELLGFVRPTLELLADGSWRSPAK